MQHAQRPEVPDEVYLAVGRVASAAAKLEAMAGQVAVACGIDP